MRKKNKTYRDALRKDVFMAMPFYADRANKWVTDSSMFKPAKYHYEPYFTITVPWLYIDEDYENSRKGLFFEWKEIDIGRRQVANKNYRKELKKWKKEKNTVYFVNTDNFKVKNLTK